MEGCSICEMGFDPEAGTSGHGIVQCEQCGGTAHADCWEEAGGCQSIRCRPTTPAPLRTPARPEPPAPPREAAPEAIDILDVGSGPSNWPTRPYPPAPSHRASSPVEIDIVEADLVPQDFTAFSPRGGEEVLVLDERELGSGDPWAATRMGPRGKVRSPLAVLVLHVVTVGLYYLRWIFDLFEEAHAHADGRRDVRIPDGATAVTIFALLPAIAALFAAVIVLFRVPVGLPWLYPMAAYAVPGLALPFAIAGWIQTAGLVTHMRRAAGVRKQDAGNTMEAAWWLVLPVVGAALFCLQVQRDVNAYWTKEVAG